MLLYQDEKIQEVIKEKLLKDIKEAMKVYVGPFWLGS
jgi:hypothetical protein